ncbi:DNA polymerase I [Priestia filamentosa]|uniref:DNA polymerase I n=1 Tax=Priestia filamentosa TaxID=1402861 RepID=A0A1X7CRK9_9BACI|nr:DNA polymerase I [Priestia filamentosa]AKO94379.1 DNA polymerase I [Priestia filamentosa]MDT3764665.1 DNA polymerase I [Priestia filamentosa]OXS70889.1 DNA polymerase I [Priestia filamentosa]RJS66522.1 DNA polymerase I [Priestia filamentosa]WCM15269.1 DNA polymerase I [Priestia filamentosa]
MTKKLVLVDGNSIAYRAFFALPLLSNDKGIHTNAIYGFTTILTRILEEEKPTHMLVAFDAGKTTFRHKTFTEYKGGRQKTPPELSEQFSFIRELLDVYGISRYELTNYEADDIIGTLSLTAEKEDFEVKVITGDKDLLQLVSPKTTVAITKKGITEVDAFTPEKIDETYGISSNQIIDMKGLMGDKSDNIPGVEGIGEKTALKLLKEFGSVEEVLNSIDQISGKKMKERLEENKETALMSKELATIMRDSPIEISLAETEYKGYDEEKLIALYKELGFKSMLEKLDVEVSESAELQEIHPTVLKDVKEEHLEGNVALTVELFDENYHHGDILGFGLVGEKESYYIDRDTALQSEVFVKWLEDESKKKAVFDIKRAAVALKWNHVELRGVDFDLLIAAYLIDPAQSHEDVAAVAKLKGYGGQVQGDEEVYGKGAKRAVPNEESLAEHTVRKAFMIKTLKEPFLKDLEENNQLSLFNDLEMPLALVLGEMEVQGVHMDMNRLEEMGKEIGERLSEYEKNIYALAGEEFNINSPKQLGVVLFENLGLPPIKKTKTGYSTSADVLEKLASKHEIVSEILQYRQLGKLQSTYIEGLKKVVYKETDKVHTRFNQTLTQTGRLSSTDPNLQNIPIRLEEGKKIRQAFVPSHEGWMIFAADYSQIELRVLAHIAQDKKLINAFKHDLDIHTQTAMDVFKVERDEVTDNMRRHAKAVNFGIVYGISDYGLSQSLNISRKEAQKFIDRYLESFPGVQAYMNNIIQDAKEAGYVTTLLHRRRYLPELTSRNFNLRSFAERTAMNTPIQGSAADIIKKAMLEVQKRLKEEELEAKLLLQVHDELIFEAPTSEIEKLQKLVPEVMEHAIELSVPLKVDHAYGETWFDAK